MAFALAERARRRGFRSIPLVPGIALIVIALYGAAVILAPLLAPHGETEVVGGLYEPWGGQFLLGTDNLGRDMLSRLLYGARNTIGLAVAITALSFAIGVSAGLCVAVSSPWLDQAVSRTVDVLISIPKLIFALLILSVVGTSTVSLVLTVALLDATRMFRVARAAAFGISTLEFVEVSRLRGESRWWIMLHDLLPNSITVLLAECGLRFGYVFLFISALGFLGLGIQPPSADWGTMVRENATLISFGQIAPIAPAAAIALLTLAVNFVIDWTGQITTEPNG